MKQESLAPVRDRNPQAAVVTTAPASSFSLAKKVSEPGDNVWQHTRNPPEYLVRMATGTGTSVLESG